MQLQKVDDVALDLGGGGGGKGSQNRTLGERGHEVRNAQVAGAEILPPLGDAVRLVHGYERNVQPLHQRSKALCVQPLGGNIQELVAAVLRCLIDAAELLGR